jgi:hypothetical protein
LKSDLKAQNEENNKLKAQLAELQNKSEDSGRVKELEEQLAEEKSKYSEMEKEHEDLLVCLGK